MIHAIINPVSGAGADPGAASRRAAMIRAAAEQRDIDVTIAVTARQGHARELGEKAGVSKDTISRIEREGTAYPATIRKLAKALDVDPSALVPEEE